MHLPPVLAESERLVEIDCVRVAGVARTATGTRVTVVVADAPAPIEGPLP